jgi:hypothetical protein
MAKDKTDKAFLDRVKKHAPDVLESEVDFEASVSRVVRADPEAVKRKPKKRKRRSAKGP